MFFLSSLKNSPWLRLGGVAVGIILFDQGSKLVGGSLLSNSTQLNPGLAFGWLIFLGNNSSRNTAFFLISIGLLLVLFSRMWLAHPGLSGLFFGGAISNVIDRLLLGGVRDWLPIPFTNLYNNIADWCIFFALAGMFWQEAFQARGQIKNANKFQSKLSKTDGSEQYED